MKIGAIKAGQEGGICCNKPTDTGRNSSRNDMEVTNDGIYQNLGNGYSKLVMSREVFVEAFNKWCLSGKNSY